MNKVRTAITDARRAFPDSTRWSSELMSDTGPSYEANIQAAIDEQMVRIERLETALAGIISHWREFGPMMVFNNAVNRDDYGLDERMDAAAKLVPDRVAV